MHNVLIKGVLQGLVLVVVAITVVYIFSASLLGIFSQNPEIIALASAVIGFAVFTEIGRVLNMVVGLSVKAVGHAKFLALFGVSAMWMISLPFTWFLGVYGLWPG